MTTQKTDTGTHKWELNSHRGDLNNPEQVEIANTISVQLSGSNPTENIVTIASGVSLSSAVDLGEQTPVGLIMPATWTAANLTYQVSTDDVSYNNLYDNAGIEISHVVDVSRFIRLNPADWIGVRYVKLRSGTSGTPVNQGSDRTIKLVTKAV